GNRHTSIHYSATVSGSATPTGTVTFNLYGPADATCTGSVVFANTQPLSAGSATSADYVTTQAGTYHWAASYSGDANNAGVTSACANEAVTVAQTTTSVIATPTPGNYEIYSIND